MPESWNIFGSTTFQHPWAFITPLLFLLAFFFLRRKSAAISHPAVSELSQIPLSLRQLLRTPLLALLIAGALIALTLGAARPQDIRTVREPLAGRNLMLALDISKSMSAGDFGGQYARATRLEAVKSVVSEFVRGRKGDRIGLVVFGSNAFLQSPLTMDHSLVQQMVKRLRTGLAGDGTAIGDGLGLAIKRVEGIDAESRAVILLTDGVSNAGKVNPIQAARVARDLNITVHTIGIGSKGGNSMRLPGGMILPRFGARAEFDEQTLREIASLTGGVYFHASNLKGLKKVYEEIDRLERTETEEPSRKQVVELFPPYIFAALLLYLSVILLARSVFLKVP